MATPRQRRIERKLAAILAPSTRRREFIAILGGGAVWSFSARRNSPTESGTSAC